MRRGIIFFTFGITLIFLSALFFQSFSPFNLEKIQELVIQNEIQPGEDDKLNIFMTDLRLKGKILEYVNGDFYIGIVIGLTGIFLIFNTIHLTLDKLFFKNFYEKASFFDSVRRGFILVLTIFFFVLLNLSGYLAKDLILGVILILLLEVLFTIYIKDSILQFLQKTYQRAQKAQPATIQSVAKPVR